MNNVKKSIGWADFTLNPVKGLCPNSDCPLFPDRCYARRMYKRFKWEPGLRFYPIKDDDLPKKPSRIFVGSTMELFGEWVDAFWMDSIFKSVKDNPQHTFIFLTKRPENLVKWSSFPDNCWVGVSVTANGDMTKAFYGLSQIKAAKTFISFEPLLGDIGIKDHRPFKSAWLSWVIIGQLTPIKRDIQPKIEWVSEIVEAADKAGIPVFLKYNLVGLLPIENPFYKNDGSGWAIRQEFPDAHT